MNLFMNDIIKNKISSLSDALKRRDYFRKLPKKDRLAEVVSYNILNNSVRVRDIEEDCLFDVAINPDMPVVEIKNMAWNGYTIGARMASIVNIGERIIISGSKKSGFTDKDGVSLLHASQIHYGDLLRATVTMKKDFRDPRIRQVNVWNGVVKTGGINPEKNEAAIDELADRLEKNYQKMFANTDRKGNHNQLEERTFIGVKFRTLVPAIDENNKPISDDDGKPVYHVVNTTDEFGWMPETTDENNKIVPYHPLNKEDFFDLLTNYMDYALGSEELKKDSLLAGTALEHLAEHSFVEVLWCETYLASSFENSFCVDSSARPFYKFVNTKTFYSIGANRGSDDTINEFAASNAIVVFSGNKTRRAYLSSSFVSNISFTEENCANIHEMIKTSNGSQAYLHPKLRNNYRYTLNNGNGVRKKTMS